MADLLYKDEAFAVVGAGIEVHRTLGWASLKTFIKVR